MDFNLTEEQKILQKTARDFLEAECPSSFVREMETNDRGYTSELWGKMAELGWMALIIPEEYEGVIVRVAGYSDYFVRLSRDLQDEIISRTEHGW